MDELLKELGDQPFSLSIDASNHNHIKLLPLIIRFYTAKTGLRTRILDLVSLTDETADTMYNWICAVLVKHGLKIENMTALCADNAPVNFGRPEQLREGREGNNLYSKLKQRRQNLIPIGCSGSF